MPSSHTLDISNANNSGFQGQFIDNVTLHLAKWLDEPGPLEAISVGYVARDGGEGHNHVLDTRQT